MISLYFSIIQFFKHKHKDVNFMQSISIIYFLLLYIKMSGMWTNLVQHFWWIRTRFFLKGGSHIRSYMRKQVAQSRLRKSTRWKNSRSSNFIKGKLLIFQDCNLLHDPSTGLLCRYNTGFVWIEGEVLVLANTLYCFKELAKVMVSTISIARLDTEQLYL